MSNNQNYWSCEDYETVIGMIPAEAKDKSLNLSRVSANGQNPPFMSRIDVTFNEDEFRPTQDLE
jgi:hypothetical protein